MLIVVGFFAGMFFIRVQLLQKGVDPNLLSLAFESIGYR